MATKKFCSRMHYNISSVFNRSNKIWCTKGIIHYKR